MKNKIYITIIILLLGVIAYGFFVIKGKDLSLVDKDRVIKENESKKEEYIDIIDGYMAIDYPSNGGMSTKPCSFDECLFVVKHEKEAEGFVKIKANIKSVFRELDDHDGVKFGEKLCIYLDNVKTKSDYINNNYKLNLKDNDFQRILSIGEEDISSNIKDNLYSNLNTNKEVELSVLIKAIKPGYWDNSACAPNTIPINIK